MLVDHEAMDMLVKAPEGQSSSQLLPLGYDLSNFNFLFVKLNKESGLVTGIQLFFLKDTDAFSVVRRTQCCIFILWSFN